MDDILTIELPREEVTIIFTALQMRYAMWKGICERHTTPTNPCPPSHGTVVLYAQILQKLRVALNYEKER